MDELPTAAVTLTIEEVDAMRAGLDLSPHYGSGGDPYVPNELRGLDSKLASMFDLEEWGEYYELVQQALETEVEDGGWRV